MHLDTVCTMVDVDKIVMYPNVADSLMAYAVTLHDRNGEADADLVLQVAAADRAACPARCRGSRSDGVRRGCRIPWVPW